MPMRLPEVKRSTPQCHGADLPDPSVPGFMRSA
jgi:hypothetical protein